MLLLTGFAEPSSVFMGFLRGGTVDVAFAGDMGTIRVKMVDRATCEPVDGIGGIRFRGLVVWSRDGLGVRNRGSIGVRRGCYFGGRRLGCKGIIRLGSRGE